MKLVYLRLSHRRFKNDQCIKGFFLTGFGSRRKYSRILIPKSIIGTPAHNSQATTLPSRRELSDLGRYVKFSSPESNSCLATSFPHWFKSCQEQRKSKLTASTFPGAIGYWRNRRVQLWLEKIGAIEPFSGSIATYWNNMKEQEALERYQLITGNEVLSPAFQVYKQDDPESEWLAASPDGEIYELPSKHSKPGVLEIKCPFYAEQTKTAKPWARVPLHYIIQAQGLMEIFNKDWIDFYVWTPRGSSLFRINRDLQFWLALKHALSDFWWKHVYPAKELYNKHEFLDPLLEPTVKSFMPAPKHEHCNEILQIGTRVVAESRLLVYEIGGKLQDM